MSATIMYIVKAFYVAPEGVLRVREFGTPIMVIDIVTDAVTVPPNPEDGYSALLIEGLQLWRKAMDEQPEFDWVLTVAC